jgi:hypothetical protein
MYLPGPQPFLPVVHTRSVRQSLPGWGYSEIVCRHWRCNPWSAYLPADLRHRGLQIASCIFRSPDHICNKLSWLRYPSRWSSYTLPNCRITLRTDRPRSRMFRCCRLNRSGSSQQPTSRLGILPPGYWLLLVLPVLPDYYLNIPKKLPQSRQVRLQSDRCMKTSFYSSIERNYPSLSPPLRRTVRYGLILSWIIY